MTGKNDWTRLNRRRISRRLLLRSSMRAELSDGLLTSNLKDFARLDHATLHVFSRVGHGVPREVASAYSRAVTDVLEHGVVNAQTIAEAAQA